MPDATNAGILLPTTFMNQFDDAEFLLPECRAGVVVALGPGRLAPDGSRIPMPPISVGQKVIVGPAKGERVELYGQSLQESSLFLFTPEEVRMPTRMPCALHEQRQPRPSLSLPLSSASLSSAARSSVAAALLPLPLLLLLPLPLVPPLPLLLLPLLLPLSLTRSPWQRILLQVWGAN